MTMDKTQGTAAFEGQPHGTQCIATTGFDQNKPFRFLDLPPELRNRIYYFDLVSNDPTALHFEPTGSSRLYGFTMIPTLPMVSKQLRLETQRLFLDKNEFELTHEVSKQESIVALLALDRVHHAAGTELRTLHISHEVMSRCSGHLFKFKATFTFSKVGGCIKIAKQAYSSTSIPESPANNRPPPSFDVCGCEMQRLAEEFNLSSKVHGVVPFLQHLKRNGVSSNRLSPMHSDRGVHRSTICWDCPKQVLQGPGTVWFRPFV